MGNNKCIAIRHAKPRVRSAQMRATVNGNYCKYVEDPLTVQTGRQPSFAFVQRGVSVLVRDGYQRVVLAHQLVRKIAVAPEARVVKGSVSMLVDCVDFCTVLKQLDMGNCTEGKKLISLPDTKGKQSNGE